MSVYYIKARMSSGEDVFYFLDSTSRVRTSFPARLSSNPIANGETVADNYTTEPVTITYTGRITDIKSTSAEASTKTTKEYIDGLTSIMRTGTPVSALAQVGRPEFENCFFTALDIEQNNFTGYAGNSNLDGQPVNAYSIDFTLQQILYATGAQVTVAPSTDFQRAFQEKQKASSTTKQPPEMQQDIVDGFANRERARLILESVQTGAPI